MAKVISFEKFQTLSAIGLTEREARAMQHAPQFHSVSENFVDSMAHRAIRSGAKRGQ